VAVTIGGLQTVADQSSSWDAAVPTGLADDDYWVILFVHEGNDGPVSTPSGFTVLQAEFGTGTFGGNIRFVSFYKKVTSAAGESAASLANTGYTKGVVHSYYHRGADGTTFLDAANTTNTGGTDTSAVATGITTATDGAMSVMGAGVEGQHTQTPPSTYTEFADTVSGDGEALAIHYKEIASAAATGNLTATISSSTDWAVLHYVVRPAATGPTIVEGTATVTFGGTVTATGPRFAQDATGSLTFGGTVAVTGTKETHGTATVSFGGTVTATGTKVAQDATGSVAFGGLTTTTNGTRVAEGTAAIAFGGAVTATGARTVAGTGSLSFGGTVTGTGTRTAEGSAVVSFGGTTDATGQVTHHGTGALDFGGQVAATGTIPTDNVTGTVTVSYGGTVEAAGTRTIHGTATVGFGGSVAVTGTVHPDGVGVISFGGSVTATGTRVAQDATAVVSFGGLTVRAIDTETLGVVYAATAGSVTVYTATGPTSSTYADTAPTGAVYAS